MSRGMADVFVLTSSVYLRKSFGGIHVLRGGEAAERIGIPIFSTRAFVKNVETDGNRVIIAFDGFVSGRLVLSGFSDEEHNAVLNALGENAQ